MVNDVPPLVLLVEDEEIVRMMLAEVLARRGWATVEAGTAAEALEKLDVEPSIRLTIIDVMMPGGIDGIELARLVANRRPDLPILVTSGHAELSSVDLPPGARFLPKPFSSQGIGWAIDEVMATSFRR